MEKMVDFFATRVEGYDNHMLTNVTGCAAAYKKMASILPPDTKCILDLGCGTGLELDEIFKIHPNLHVTGIDMTQEMLDQLKQKHPDKHIDLINENYLNYDFGTCKFDIAISFQTMHHFSHALKIQLYSKILSALKDGGQYIECDYMVLAQEEEDLHFSENKRIRSEQNIPLDDFYHYDTPCTVKNQMEMFLQSGFSKSEVLFREENTTIIVASK